jgi:RHS repeat-associated protein
MSLQTLINYRYDALDRLIGADPVGQSPATRFYRNNQMVNQTQGDQHYGIMQENDHLIGQSRRVGDKVENTLLVTNQQRTVVQTVTAGAREDFSYTAYGHCPIEGGLHSLLGFNGEQPDPVTGCYLLGNGYRAYNPVLMRFHSPDSLSPFGAGGVNPYAYCAGDPINLTDPTGHFSWRSIFKIAVAVVSIVVAVATLVLAPVASHFALGAVADIASNVLGIASILATELAPDSDAGKILGGVGLAFGAFGFAAGRGWLGKGKAPTALVRTGAIKATGSSALKKVAGSLSLGRNPRNTVAAANHLLKVHKTGEYVKYSGYAVDGIGIVEDYVIPYISPPQANRGAEYEQAPANAPQTSTGFMIEDQERIERIRMLA